MSDSDKSFDGIVIGAGINGVGIARDAAQRGLRVVVLEQDDICSGVSAWSRSWDSFGSKRSGDH